MLLRTEAFLLLGGSCFPVFATAEFMGANRDAIRIVAKA